MQIENTEIISSNAELKGLFVADQAERKNLDLNNPILVESLSKKDSDRKSRVSRLLQENKIRTAEDYYHAAMIYQHGSSIEDIQKAMELAEKSFKLGEMKARWLSAATKDRFLMYQAKPQKYGTQFVFNESIKKWELYPVDPGTTDKEREEMNVPKLTEIDATISQLPKFT